MDIVYDLASDFTGLFASLEISSDGGATWTVPAVSVSGDVGLDVVPGAGKTIVWDAGADWAGQYSEQMRFRVVVDDSEALVAIPAGSFTMGATSGDMDFNAPSITVTVSDFHLSRHETTKAQWDEVRDWGLDNGYSDLPEGEGKGADHPVYWVTWWDAVKWCNARSEMKGLSPVYTVAGEVMRTGETAPSADWTANGYRLPTEAEWEKAARGGVEGMRFPWGGDEINHDHANYRANGSAYSYDTSPYTMNTHHPDYFGEPWPYTAPVGSFAANGFGLYDMAGNVGEWCWDWFLGDFYGTSDGTTDPRGPASGTGRVIRGGAYSDDASTCRAAHRLFASPDLAGGDIGFRPVRSSVP